MTQRKWIKKGMVVVSMTDLETPMTVEDFIYKTGTILDKDNNKVEKKFLINVQCYHYVNQHRVHERFHSRELIPYAVARKGVNEAFRFYNREGEYKEDYHE